ncbi:MAG: (2Fe-2S) ferredoxin domain-containing protein [Lachnospiraceae bacterium]
MDLFRAHVLVCGGTGCSSSGSAELIKRFEEQIAKNGLDKEVKVVRTGCFGLCEAGPVVIVYPEGTFYSRIKVDDVDEIVSEHLLKGRTVQHLDLQGKRRTRNSTLRAGKISTFYRPRSRTWLCGTAWSYRPRKHRRIYCFRRLSRSGQVL